MKLNIEIENQNITVQRYIDTVISSAKLATSLRDLQNILTWVFKGEKLPIIYGFGGSHFWVKCKTSDERLLLVTEK